MLIVMIIVMTLRLSNFQLESCNCFVFFLTPESVFDPKLICDFLFIYSRQLLNDLTMSIIVMDVISFSDQIRLNRATSPR